MRILEAKQFKILRSVYPVLFLVIVLAPSYVFSSGTEGKQSSRADSISFLRIKYSGRTTLENIASIPGYLAYAPLKSVLEVQKFLIQQAFVPRVVEANFFAKLIDIFIADDGSRGITPTYSSSSGGGLKFYQKGLISSNSKLSLSATVGLRQRHRYQFRFKNIELGEGVITGFLMKYHFQSDESFFGIGPNSDKDDRTNYAHELLAVEVNVGIQLGRDNLMGINAGFERSDIQEGKNRKYPSTTDVAAFSFLPGMQAAAEMGKLEMEIRHDSRNHPARPTSGFEALLRGSVYREVDKDHFGFSRITVDVSRYFHLFFYRTLKIRFAGEFTEPMNDRLIPFYYLSEMGRSETVRGFTRGRFRDEDMVLGSVEYIYPIWDKINARMFLDAGTVSGNIAKEFDVDNLKYGYGTGFLLWNAEEVVADFSIAHSRDGFRFYLDLNVSF